MTALRPLNDVFADGASDTPSHSLLAIGETDDLSAAGLSPSECVLAKFQGFSGKAGSHLISVDSEGHVARVIFGLGGPDSGDPCGPSHFNLGYAPQRLPAGDYELTADGVDPTQAAIAWGLGAYVDRRFKSDDGSERPRLIMPEGADGPRVRAIVGGAHLARDLINAPANRLGPDDIAATLQDLAGTHGADTVIHRGEADGFREAFPLVHAVGRASTRPPRVIDLTWAGTTDPSAPTLTLIGKGIVFDTGGLDIKPAAAMLLMKKDMGGAAAAIAAAHMIMALNLPVRLRLVIATAENAVAGDAFRPGDVITSRDGTTVEIGNTDAEGRLVLADAITLADTDKPDVMMTFATLTGAARVALGPDLPAMFASDDTWARTLETAGLEVADPVWRMPLWPGYRARLASHTADMSNVSDGPFAGAITAALFLQTFVKNAGSFVHFDLYGWRQTGRALGPKGGEGHVARAVLQALEHDLSSRQTNV